MPKSYKFIIRVFNEDGTYKDTEVVVRAYSEIDAEMKLDDEAYRMTRGGERGYDCWMVKE